MTSFANVGKFIITCEYHCSHILIISSLVNVFNYAHIYTYKSINVADTSGKGSLLIVSLFAQLPTPLILQPSPPTSIYNSTSSLLLRGPRLAIWCIFFSYFLI